MKFKFCADGDCPLWALAALHALGALPAPLFRALLQHVVQQQPDDGIMEILKDTSLYTKVITCIEPQSTIILDIEPTNQTGIIKAASRDECARAAAVLRWTLRQAYRNNCSGVQLARDLLVLGVPRAHAAALAETADSTRETYEGQVKSAGFMINKLTDATVSEGPEDTVETVKLTLHSDEVFSGEQKMTELLIDKTQVGTLLQELKKAKKIMDEFDVQ